ncbi:hypothetical protein ACFU8I_02645 [Streptomyces sp. NPDC057540]|uniref:hypothetical protein n=1 Tax=Streptomyces sp. NPDC057540 TaxID=3346160 RepID=UPI0036BDDF48
MSARYELLHLIGSDDDESNAMVDAVIAEALSEPFEWARTLDAKSLDNFLTTLGLATEHEPMDEAIDRIHALIRSFRDAVLDGAR